MSLDVYTLFICELFVLGFMSIIMLFAWAGSQYDRVLGFTTVALIATLLAMMLSSLRSSGHHFLPIAVGNVILYFGYGMLVNAFRTFRGLPLGINWLTGALLWAILCLFPQFYFSLPKRVIVTCLLCIIFTAVLIRLLYGARTLLPATYWPAQLLLVIHLGFHVARLFLDAGRPNMLHGAIGGTQFTVWIMLESMLFVMGLTFTILAMVNERTRLIYQQASLLDPLTGIANRRALFAEGNKLADWCRRHRQPLTVVLFDLDHFKSINDRFGHHQGDRVLIDFCRVVSLALPPQAQFARLGGEEFAAVLSLNEFQGKNWCEQVRRAVHASAPEEVIYTTSIGMTAVVATRIQDVESLLVAADEALYRAKTSGRNRVEVFTPLAEERELANQL